MNERMKRVFNKDVRHTVCYMDAVFAIVNVNQHRMLERENMYMHKKLSCSRVAARRSASLKIIENGTIRKLRYGFLFAFHSKMAVSLAVLTQYTNVTDTRHSARQTLHDGIGRAMHIIARQKNYFTMNRFTSWRILITKRYSVTLQPNVSAVYQPFRPCSGCTYLHCTALCHVSELKLK